MARYKQFTIHGVRASTHRKYLEKKHHAKWIHAKKTGHGKMQPTGYSLGLFSVTMRKKVR